MGTRRSRRKSAFPAVPDEVLRSSPQEGESSFLHPYYTLDPGEDKDLQSDEQFSEDELLEKVDDALAEDSEMSSDVEDDLDEDGESDNDSANDDNLSSPETSGSPLPDVDGISGYNEASTEMPQLARTAPAPRRGGWKWALKGTAHEKTHGSAVRKRGRPSGSSNRTNRRATRRPPIKDPGAEFKEVMGEATEAFLMGDEVKALESAEEAIRINPDIARPHSLMAEIYDRQGFKFLALGTLCAVALLNRDLDLWEDIGYRTLELQETKENKRLEQALHCFSMMLKIDHRSVRARLGRLKVLLEKGNILKAKRECERILQLEPNRMEVIRQLANLSVGADSARCITHFKKAIEHHMAHGHSADPGFSFSDVSLYVQCYLDNQSYLIALKLLRQLSRWLLGREEEHFWDDVLDDDREWDLESNRRVEIPQFTLGEYDDSAYGAGLPIELRVKLGTIRLALRTVTIEEALNHFEFLHDEWVNPSDQIIDLTWIAADSLYDQYRYSDALHYYELLKQCESESDEIVLWERLSACYTDGGDLTKATEAVQTGLKLFPADLTLLRRAVDILSKQDKPGELQEMLERTQRVCDQRDETPQEPPRRPRRLLPKPTSGATPDSRRSVSRSESPPFQRRRRATEPIPVYREREFQDLAVKIAVTHGLLITLDQERGQFRDKWDRKRHHRKWMKTAKSLTDIFRKQKRFYPGRHDKWRTFTGYGRMQNPRQEELDGTLRTREDTQAADTIPSDFGNVSFEDWLNVFLRYAVELAKEGSRDHSYEILQAVDDANVFYHDEDFICSAYLCWILCAAMCNDEERLCRLARWFMSRYPFSTSTFRLYSALNRLFKGQPSAYRDDDHKKALMRFVKSIDYALLPEDARRDSSLSIYDQQLSGSGRVYRPEGVVQEMDPELLTLYGHILITGGSSESALQYYYRAYVITPDDPILNLSLGVACINMGTERSTKERQAFIQQAMSFLDKYRAVREATGKLHLKQEAEYNIARAYHMLGLTHIAIEGYERVLEMGREIAASTVDRMDVDSDGDNRKSTTNFAPEAAHALQQILAHTGNGENAMALMQEFLTF